jgi:uncharacterized protein YndB with AHSA1/START domain
MRATRVRQHVRAPRAQVYRALLDPRALARWRVPDGMRAQVHVFEPREGGAVRVSLTYDAPTNAGKTTPRTDTYHGRFLRLVEDEEVVERLAFETADPAMQGEMTITFRLSDAQGGTDVLGLHEDVPPGVSLADNEQGWRMALAKLAAWVEAKAPSGPDVS